MQRFITACYFNGTEAQKPWIQHHFQDPICLIAANRSRKIKYPEAPSPFQKPLDHLGDLARGWLFHVPVVMARHIGTR